LASPAVAAIKKPGKAGAAVFRRSLACHFTVASGKDGPTATSELRPGVNRRKNRPLTAPEPTGIAKSQKGTSMADTVTLTKHEAIRDWAAARMGFPAIIDASAEGGVQPVLRIVFDQQAYADTDQPERPQNAGGYELVEWDEWFRIFDEQQLALVVAREVPGQRESFHEIVRR
jgi:hypothetical protein